MNIVFVSNQPFPSGMAGSKRIRLFAEYLAKSHSVSLIVAGKNNGTNAESGSLNQLEYNFFKFSRVQSFTAYFKVKKIVKERLKKESKNVLFLYDGIGLTNYLFAVIGRRLGYKIVTDVVEDYSLHEENTGFLLTALYKINVWFEKHTSKFVDGVIVISSRLKEKFQKLNINENKITLIGVSAENINVVSDKKTKAICFTFLYSGSFGTKDGIGFLVEAFKLFSEKRNDVELLLAGKINPKILALIKDENKIKYVGLVPDEQYYQFLSDADVLLMTRIDSGYAHSGFPFKLGEYLATGKPVIATRVSDIASYLNDKEDVLFAEPSNVNSLVDLFNFAINNQEAIIQIGKKGQKKCKLFFDPEVNGSQLERFLLEICNAS